MNKNKKSAFTLAEVLIVIGIIGVVAALTLPNLNHATGDKEKVTKVKKIYSALTEAVDRAQAIYGPFDTWFKDLADDAYSARTERFAKRVTEFLKVSKDCGFDEGCFSNAPLLLENGEILEDEYFNSLSVSRYMVATPDGMSLSFNEEYGKIGVDIDGPNKGKNQIGNDIFDFTIKTSKDNLNLTSNQLYPAAKTSDINGIFNSSRMYHNVTAWVIENGNLDYLKCPDELNWETKTSCE